jgi:peptide/nickel transport system substrate-binding protein
VYPRSWPWLAGRSGLFAERRPPESGLSRRAFVSAGVALASELALGSARARGRLPVGGKASLHVPWPLAQVDPHAIDDATAAILGGALFETLYAADEAGTVTPQLAEAEPQPEGQSLRVTLRPGVRTASGRAIDAKDVAFSIARARAAGAKAWLTEVPVPKQDGSHALVFAGKDSAKLTRSLASPLVAIVPRTFVPERPDGTGPFRAQRQGDGLALRRNPFAASGPSFLEEVDVHAAQDLAASLSAFESGADDIGWLGSGLHEPRPGSQAFDGGMVAWAVLRTGHDAAGWDAPGVAQRLAAGIAPGRLSYLFLGPAWHQEADDGWGGAPCDLVVRDDAVWLLELARAVAASLSRPSHEVVAKAVPAAELAQRRASRAYVLALDVVRPLAPTPLGALASLSTADNPAAAADAVRFPPLGLDPSPRALTRTLRVGVVGEVRVQGGRAPALNLAVAPGGGFDFGATVRTGR